jgi:adenosylcobinamide-GDP ribazoletransferase
MKHFLIALQFLTVIPVKTKDISEGKLSWSMVYFPIIGLLLGLILVGINNLLLFLNFEQFVTNVILVISLIILTGGLHLDGLADTMDALLSRKDKEEMLKIMRDSHIGVMGVLSLFCIILLKIAFLSSIDASLKIITLLLMCTLSKWSLVLSMSLFPYAREEGKAKIFMQDINHKIFSLATIIAVVPVILVWQLKGLLIFIITAISACIINKFISNKINGLTGDTLGAVNEFIEVIILFCMCVLGRSNLWG